MRFALFEGEKVIEKGEFEAVLDREYGLVSVRIDRARPAGRRGTALVEYKAPLVLILLGSYDPATRGFFTA